MGNPQVTDAEIGWLAGMIDGEGSIAIQRCHHNTPSGRKGYYSPRCQVVNTDPALIATVVDLLTRFEVRFYITTNGSSDRRKELFTIRVDGMEDIARLLAVVTPHLRGEKYARARLLMQYVTARMRHGKNVKGNKFLSVPYTSEESAMAEALLHGNLNDCTRDGLVTTDA